MVRIFLLSLFILGINVINAQPQTFKKDMVKSFNVNTATTLLIDNYNGDIDFELWAKNEIEVSVSFEVTTSKVEKAQTYLRALSSRIKTDTNYIEFISLINKDSLDRTFNKGKSTYKINYHVKLPVYLNLTVKNYYGDIHLTESSGRLNISLNYGTFTASNLTSDESKSISKIDVNYGDCIIYKCNFLNVDANYSVVKVSNAQSITGKTTYSEIYADDVLSMVLKSRYDKIQIGKTSKINVDMAYSKLKISNVLYDIQCVVKYTPVDIDFLSESFTNASFDLTYSDVHINVSKQACFNLNAKAKYGKIYIPKRANVNNYMSPVDMKTVGTIGCISGANSQMTIDSNFGDVNITDH